jgi:hypothetical protein
LNGGVHTDYVVDVGLTRPYTFTGLLANTEYEIEAATYDEDDVESGWSPVVTQTTAEEGEEPPAPSFGEETMLIDGDGDAWIDEDGFALTMYL